MQSILTCSATRPPTFSPRFTKFWTSPLINASKSSICGGTCGAAGGAGGGGAGLGGSGVAGAAAEELPILLDTLGSSRDIAMSSKREVAASSLFNNSIVSMIYSEDMLHALAKIERQGQPAKDHAATNKNYTYRLMRVVKLCIWPPLAMVGNTLLEEAGKGRNALDDRGGISRL